jgi:hypothetical protein
LSKWLNGQLKDTPNVKHELFATEADAIAALGKLLDLHK